MADTVVGYTTLEPKDAPSLADALVSEGLVACVQIVSNIQSVYRWKGAIEHSEESLLILKTAKTKVQELKSWIRANHPYETPELVFVPVEDGLTEYLQWVTVNLSP